MTGISLKSLSVFFQQLEALMTAGVGMAQALDSLAQESGGRMGRLVFMMASDVRGGAKFSEALRRHPRVFGDFAVEMTRAGETSGTLSSALGHLADFFEREHALHSQVVRALVYPLFLVIASVFLLPLSVLFVGTPTDYLMQTAVPFGAALGILAGARILHYYFSSSPSYNRVREIMLGAIPLFGAARRKTSIARFLRMLAALVGAGAGARRAIEVAAGACGNAALKEKLQRATVAIDAGRPFADALQSTGALPRVVASMLAVGQEAGSFERAALKAAEYYEQESAAAMKLVMTMLPPVLLLLVGGYIGWRTLTSLLQYYSPLLEIR